jgi:hypothetical protein
MRVSLISCLVVTLLGARDISAQRLSQLEPGTLIRLALRTGGPAVIGPLAEVRADTVYLSSTVTSPGAAVALANVASFEYADSTAASHAGRGALLGGAIGAGVGYLAARGPGNRDDASMFLNGRTIVTFFAIVGTVLGAVFGADETPVRWVLPTRAQSALQPVGQGLSLGFVVRF